MIIPLAKLLLRTFTDLPGGICEFKQSDDGWRLASARDHLTLRGRAKATATGAVMGWDGMGLCLLMLA